MPRVAIKTGFVARDGREVQLIEYLCDAPGCPNIATHALGCVQELTRPIAVCEEHAPAPLRKRPRNDFRWEH